MNTLLLSVNKQPFDVMVTGEKKIEIRRPSAWILNRLFDRSGKQKAIDRIKVVNGYGHDRPYFICDFCGFTQANQNYELEYSNGLKVQVIEGYLLIKCGEIKEKGNIS